MSLTGREIERQIELGRITIDPPPEKIGPNSVDLRIADELIVYEHGWELHSFLDSARKSGHLQVTSLIPLFYRGQPLDLKKDDPTYKIPFPEDGAIMWPGVLYLARTMERVHTDHHKAQLAGRSSIGRKGLKVHFTAGFIDQGFDGTITMEMEVTHPLRIYPGSRIAQLEFTETTGDPRLYKGRYQGQVETTPSRAHMKESGGDD